MKFNAFGRRVSTTKEHKDILSESVAELIKYRDASRARKQKVVENEKWFRALHWDFFRSENYKDMPEPTTNYLLSNILNKHADMMDSFPKPNVLPKEQSDEQLAQSLTSIVPLVFQNNEFRSVYSNVAYTKLKQGYGIYSATWSDDMTGGLGDVQINEVDLTTIYFEPGIKHIQHSKSIYVVSMVDNEKLRTVLEQSNPDAVNHVGSSNVLQIEKYPTIDNIDYSNMTLVIDKYYKKNGKIHFMKFIEGAILYWTEDPKHGERYANGFYDHGKYPFIVDRLIPETESVYGIGFIDIMKNPQMYIDKFDQIMLDNLLKSGRKRFFAKENGNINEDDFADWSKDVIRVVGDVDDRHIKEFQVSQLDPGINNYRTAKINELKEISNTNEFSRGEAGKGVTAYRAIAVLQEAANKVSRDMIGDTYEACRQLYVMSIEIIRQFYDAPRMFRITNDEGVFSFQQFSNEGLKPKVDPILGTTSKADFDIIVVPEKNDPFNQAATNELMMEMYQRGFFNPDMAEQSLIAMEMMQFEGKEKIKAMIKENSKMINALNQLMQENVKLKQMVQRLTGRNLGVEMPERTQNDGSNNNGSRQAQEAGRQSDEVQLRGNNGGRAYTDRPMQRDQRANVDRGRGTQQPY